MPADFTGFPPQALDFYDDLEVDNTRSFWEKHKGTYDYSVRRPMVALCAALAPEFGEAKVFRPFRDVRFAKDKTPYKTAQGAFVGVGPATGWYVEISARGVRTGAGFYDATRSPDRRDPGRHRRRPHRARAPVAAGEARGRRLARRRPHPQDGAARVRREPPADRAAPPQVADHRPRLRLRADHPHHRAARGRARRLAHPQAVRRLGHRLGVDSRLDARAPREVSGAARRRRPR